MYPLPLPAPGTAVPPRPATPSVDTLMTRVEELDPDLAAWLTEGPLGPMIAHPLHYGT